MSKPSILLSIVAAALLAGCEARLNVASKPNTATEINVPHVGTSVTAKMSVSEMCYDGIVYLVNNRGGMAPKIDRAGAQGTTMGGSSGPFIKCPKE